MKKSLIFTLLAMILLSSVSLTAEHYPNHILFHLTPEMEPLSPEACASMETPDPELNLLIKKFNAIKLEPWVTDARPEEHDGDIYLNRIYRLVLRKDIPATPVMADEIKLKAPSVAHAELEPVMKKLAFPNDTYISYQWFLSKTGAREAWNIWDTENGEIPGSRRIVVAVVDDGVEYTHPDLWQNIWINQDEIGAYLTLVDTSGDGWVSAEEALGFAGDFNLNGTADLRDVIGVFSDNTDNDGDGAIDNIIGWDTNAEDGNADDDNNPMVTNNGHGTHVAGLAGAVSNNGIGVASVASRVSIMPVKATGDDITDNINTGWDGIMHAARAGADIINCSWGGPGYSTYAQGIINTAHNTYGSIVVAAAGNGDDEGNPSAEYHYPSGYQNVISVTAVSSQDIFSWANYGAPNPAEDFYGVDIAAPGENMYSTYLTKTAPYASLMGTSMASPLVASCLALIKSVYPDSSNEWLTARLLDHTDPIGDINPDYAGQLGSGRVNVLKSLMFDQWPSLNYLSRIESICDGDADSVLNPGETLCIRIELQNDTGWTDASNVKGILRSAHPGIEIIDSVCTWNHIPQNNSKFSEEDGFLVRFDENVLVADYPLTLALSSEPGSPFPYRKNIDVYVSLSLDQQPFPFETTSTVELAPLFLDIENDNRQEILFADKSGSLYLTDYKANVRPGFPVNLGSQPGGFAVADIDMDDSLEIVCTAFNNEIMVFNIDGKKEWSHGTGGFITAIPAIGNLDDDPEAEIVVGGYDRKIYVLNHDSTDMNGFPLNTGQNIKAGVALADLNADGKDEIVCAAQNSLSILDAQGDTLPGWPQSTSATISSEPQVVMNTNGTPVILIANDIGDIYAYDPDGTQRFMIDGSGAIKASPAVFTQNGILYAAYGSTGGNLYVLDVMNGAIAAGWPKSGSPVYQSLAVADLLPDGTDEQHILAMGNDGLIRAYDLQGQVVMGFPVNTRSLSQSGLAVTDLDNDGDNEIITGTYSGLSVIDLKSAAGDIAWSMHRGGTKRRGSVSLLFSGIADTDLPQEFDLKLLGNKPNPFNPLTTISFMVSDTEPVQLRLFALNGRQIFSRTVAHPLKGRNELSIDMSTYSSGVYVYVLTQKGYTQSGKMALLK